MRLDNVLSKTSSQALKNSGWTVYGPHPGLKNRILLMLNYTRIQNAHEVRGKTFDFLLCMELMQTFSFPFYLLKHYQMRDCFYVNNCCF